MDAVVQVVGLFVVVAAVRELARRAGLQDAILLLVAGVVLAFVPGVPSYRIAPELVLLVVLPVLLYGTAFTTSLLAFRANMRSIGMLSIGLTLFTTVVVGFVAYAVIPGLSLAAAMVLGAIVAPPDAVAAVAVGRQAGMPRRVVTILEGESLFNDAAALTAYQVAVAAVVVSGSIGLLDAGGRFLVAAAGGLAVGLVVAFVLARIRARITNPLSDTALSLFAPFVAYLPAEAIHTSGVVSVVVTGLYLGHRAPFLMDAPARVLARSVWQVIEYLVAGVVFVLIGLQLADIVAGLEGYSPGMVALASVVVVAAVVISRVLWMFPGAYLPQLLSRRLREREGHIPWPEPAIAAWAGLRGVVSLAAAFAIPLTVADGAEFPQRDLLLFLTFVVIAATLVGQGLTLPAVVRRLRPPSSEASDHAAQELATAHAAADASLQRLDELLAEENPPPEVVDRLRERVERHRLLAEQPDGDDGSEETPSQAYRRLRREMLAAARERIVQLRDAGELDDEVFRRLQHELDLEESILLRD